MNLSTDVMDKSVEGTWVNIDPEDAEFLLERIDDLPGEKDKSSPVYFMLGESVVVHHGDHPEMGLISKLTFKKFF